MEREVEDEWVETYNPSKGKVVQEAIDIDNLDGNMQNMQIVSNQENKEKEDEAFDLDDLDDDNMFAQPAQEE